MDEKELKKFMEGLTPEQREAMAKILTSSSEEGEDWAGGSNSKGGGASTSVFDALSQYMIPANTGSDGQGNSIQNRVRDQLAVEAVAQSRIASAYRKPVVSSTMPTDPNEARIRAATYEEFGMKDPVGDTYSKKKSEVGDNSLSENRVDAIKARNADPQAEVARRQGIRDGVTAKGVTGEDGSVVGPLQLRQEMLQDGADPYDAAIAAGQRFRDMTGNTEAQKEAIRNAPPEERMALMKQFKEERQNNIKELARQRLENPKAAGFSGRNVGITTEIQDPSGEVLMRRGEGRVVRATAGTQGAVGGTRDLPGKMELTKAGERAIRDRMASTTVSPSEFTETPTKGFEAEVNQNKEGIIVGTSRYGTGIGNVDITAEAKARGAVPDDFSLTPEQRVGEAPVPEGYAKVRDELLARSKSIANKQGTYSGVVNELLRRSPSGTAGAIDRRADNAAAARQRAAENKLADDFLAAYEQREGGLPPFNPDAPPAGPRTAEEISAMRNYLDGGARRSSSGSGGGTNRPTIRQNLPAYTGGTGTASGGFDYRGGDQKTNLPSESSGKVELLPGASTSEKEEEERKRRRGKQATYKQRGSGKFVRR